MGLRTSIAFTVVLASVAVLALPDDGDAYKRTNLKGRGGEVTVEVAWGTWSLDGPSFRAPEVTIGRSPGRVRSQKICVSRRLWVYGGGSYEPLRGWKRDWSALWCGTGTRVNFPALWIPRYFDAFHFDMVVTWKNPSSQKVLASERVDWDQVSNYGCLVPGPQENCRPGRYYKGVAGISFDLGG